MKIAVLGTGVVGNALRTKLVQIGNEVAMGSRNTNNEKAAQWAKPLGARARTAAFADASRFWRNRFQLHRRRPFHGSAGNGRRRALTWKNFDRRLEPAASWRRWHDGFGFLQHRLARRADSKGVPRNARGQGAQHCELRNHDRALARAGRSQLIHLRERRVCQERSCRSSQQLFGWKPENIVDLGDITAARGTEMMMPLWMRLFQGVIGHPHFNYHIICGH